MFKREQEKRRFQREYSRRELFTRLNKGGVAASSGQFCLNTRAVSRELLRRKYYAFKQEYPESGSNVIDDVTRVWET